MAKINFFDFMPMKSTKKKNVMYNWRVAQTWNLS